MKLESTTIYTLEMDDSERQYFLAILERMKRRDTDLQNEQMLSFIDDAISCMVVK